MKKTLNKIQFQFLLEEILEEKNISVSQMANDLDIGRTSLSNMKNKLPNYPQLDTLLIICNYLEIQLSDLIKIKYHDKSSRNTKK